VEARDEGVGRSDTRVAASAARTEGAVTLTHHVGQLAGQEVLPRRAVRLVRARAEEDVRAHGEGNGRHTPVEHVGLAIGVDAHREEVDAEG